MSLTITSNSNFSEVTLPPSLMMADSPELRRAITDHIEQGHARLIVDLSDVRIVDSSGLSVLVSALRCARGNGGNVILCGANRATLRILEMTHLTDLFEIFEASDDAREWLS